jgi:hypothetical protein
MSTRGELRTLLIVGGAIFLFVSLIMKKGERIKGAAFFAAWLVPGAGHLLLGKWKKGLFFFLILAATYAFGMSIAGWRPVSFDDNPFYYVGQYGSGATLLVAKLRGAEKAILRPEIHPSWFDPGLLYVCVVGLLNIVVMLNILDLKLATQPATAAPEKAPTPPAEPQPAVAAPSSTTPPASEKPA